MKDRLLGLKERIEVEIKNIDKTVYQAQDAWDNLKRFPDQQSHYMSSMAMSFHSFYSGLERIFEMIARRIDPVFPSGEHWHRDLLEQMSIDMPEARPSVISSETFSMLDDFLAFRHLMRSIYAFELDIDRLKKLLDRLPIALSYAKKDMDRFCMLLAKATSDVSSRM
jgi:hypothetical protein